MRKEPNQKQKKRLQKPEGGESRGAFYAKKGTMLISYKYPTKSDKVLSSGQGIRTITFKGKKPKAKPKAMKKVCFTKVRKNDTAMGKKGTKYQGCAKPKARPRRSVTPIMARTKVSARKKKVSGPPRDSKGRYKKK